MSHLLATNPATDETLGRYPLLNSAALGARIERAVAAQRVWARTPLARRGEALRALGTELRRHAAPTAGQITVEMGKPVTQALAEIEKCAALCDYLADDAERLIAPERVGRPGAEGLLHWCPLGVVMAIMPWNYPFWQVFRACAPALLLGNATLLKHSPGVPGCALLIEELFRRAGFPERVFQSVLISEPLVRSALADPRIRAATFTGSAAAGARIAAEAGKHLKKVVLELGGSDPYIVLADADLERAARLCVESRMLNAGQRCSAAKRLIVEAPALPAFTEAVLAAARTFVPGPPAAPATTLGPLARKNLRETVQRQVDESVAAGARLLLGGMVPDGPGNFYPATVLAGVAPGQPAFDEETFGPVACICPAANAADAVRLANLSAYGLSAAIFSRDEERARRLAAHEIEAGFVAVNRCVSSDPSLPFGGTKGSGHGRELGLLGVRELANPKVVVQA